MKKLKIRRVKVPGVNVPVFVSRDRYGVNMWRLGSPEKGIVPSQSDWDNLRKYLSRP